MFQMLALAPMYPFVDILKSPCISIGSTYMFSRIHSPNEFARIDLLKKTTKCMCLIMENFWKTLMKASRKFFSLFEIMIFFLDLSL